MTGRWIILVLSRKLNERIVINDEIAIEIVDIDRGKVRIGIIADNAIPVMREELLPVNHPLRERGTKNG